MISGLKAAINHLAGITGGNLRCGYIRTGFQMAYLTDENLGSTHVQICWDVSVALEKFEKMYSGLSVIPPGFRCSMSVLVVLSYLIKRFKRLDLSYYLDGRHSTKLLRCW